MTTPTELQASTAIAVRKIAIAIDNEQSAALRKIDPNLTVAQYTALRLIKDNPGSSGAMIARLAGVTPQSMAVTLPGLVARDLIVRRNTPGTGRAITCTTTAKGTRLLAKVDGPMRAFDQALDERLGKAGTSAAELAEHLPADPDEQLAA